MQGFHRYQDGEKGTVIGTKTAKRDRQVLWSEGFVGTSVLKHGGCSLLTGIRQAILALGPRRSHGSSKCRMVAVDYAVSFRRGVVVLGIYYREAQRESWCCSQTFALSHRPSILPYVGGFDEIRNRSQLKRKKENRTTGQQDNRRTLLQ